MVFNDKESGFHFYYQPPEPENDEEENDIIPIRFTERREPNLGTETYNNVEDCQQNKVKRLFKDEALVGCIVFWTWRKDGRRDIPSIVAIMDITKRRFRNGSIAVSGEVQILRRKESLPIEMKFWNNGRMPKPRDLDGIKHRQNSSGFGRKIEGARMGRIREEFKRRKKITPQEFEECLKDYYRRRYPESFSEEEFKEWHEMSL
jgi:hypothetical protein